MFSTILSLCLLGSALAQVPSFGKCPEVQTAVDFQLSSYMGRWYEAQRYFSEIEVLGKCITSDYTLADNNTVNMEDSKISILSGELYSLKSTARVPDPSDPAKLRVRLNNDPIGFETDYFVLGTDYDNFAVVYNCYSVKLFSVKHARILTRQRYASQSVIDAAMAIAERNGLHRAIFIKTNQSNC
ncbi:apolipoprotein D-like [Venturia canescens]|uniref:apolipoprotein D-like n=1 Tax=Venturia canescens TaxID=32260 RepID=UPI001C9C7EDB|nr:apolipoprotein D-like [Venturia canescens]